MFSYFEIDQHGKIFSVLKSSVPMEVSDCFLALPEYDASIAGRYLIDGEITPMPEPGFFWEWNDTTGQPEQKKIF